MCVGDDHPLSSPVRVVAIPVVLPKAKDRTLKPFGLGNEELNSKVNTPFEEPVQPTAEEGNKETNYRSISTGGMVFAF